MADSDDNAVAFQEILSILHDNLNVGNVSDSIIEEVEITSQACNQNSASLKKTLLKALFGLPFISTDQPMTFSAYFERMGELLDKYSPLITKLIKRELEEINTVADTLVQLLRSGKLSHEEWTKDQSEARAGLATLLKRHFKIANVKVEIAYSAIVEACQSLEQNVAWNAPQQIALASDDSAPLIDALEVDYIIDTLVDRGLLTRPRQGKIQSYCPEEIRKLLDSAVGQTSLCALFYRLASTGQNYLTTKLADELRIACIQSDYEFGCGPGTSSTQLLDYLVSREMIVLMYAPGAGIDVTLSSPVQRFIRDSLQTAYLTIDQLTELIYRSFPLYSEMTIFPAIDNLGAECCWYQDVQRRHDEFLEELYIILANVR